MTQMNHMHQRRSCGDEITLGIASSVERSGTREMQVESTVREGKTGRRLTRGKSYRFVALSDPFLESLQQGRVC